MPTLGEINFNYNKAMSQVAELNEIAGKLKKAGNDSLESCMKDVKQNWKGENSEAYISKGNKLKGKIVKSAGDISKVAATLSTMAKNIRAAELKNIETAKTVSNK